jgi:hypothetical protein
MDATRVLSLHENVKLRFIGRTLKRYIRRPVKCSPRKKTGRKRIVSTKERIKKIRGAF